MYLVEWVDAAKAKAVEWDSAREADHFKIFKLNPLARTIRSGFLYSTFLTGYAGVSVCFQIERYCFISNLFKSSNDDFSDFWVR
ncbi:MAG: hypothetical protein QG663_1821 [Thermodesulfobacteriota bacterium]|nr:hypothetical protein [Thermodesulfobacteriota bacterium]